MTTDVHDSANDGYAGSSIRVRGARVHNLRGVNIDIPRNQLVVITGPSGSGKTSLAIDTLYAEGQRQYVESLSVYARQFLHQMQRPEVDSIDGLQPTICIDQRAGSQNPRSTVATITEIYDYLRLLMARLGQPHCYRCGAPIRQQSPERIQQRVMELPEGTKIMLLAAMVRGRKGAHKDVFGRIRAAGFVRARIDGHVYELDNVPELAPRQPHHVEAVVDRLIVRGTVAARLGESIRLAVAYGEGTVVVSHLGGPDSRGSGVEPKWRDEVFSTRFACPKCDLSYEELEPRSFSFNSPYGACPVCEGLGVRTEFDPELVVPDRDRSVSDGGIAPWKGNAPARGPREALAGFLRANDADEQTPLSRLSPPLFHQLLYGDEKEFAGVLMLLEKEYATTTRGARQVQLATFRGEIPCQACGASRLRPEASHVYLGGKAVDEITAMPVSDAQTFFAGLEFTGPEQDVAAPVISEIAHRLTFLEGVGLAYLTLDRPADSLSGGELQRVRLATSIGSGLVGVCYVLDEPSVGLHPRDNRRLIESLRDLQSRGNTVIVVEHDAAMMRQADQLVDMGPGAGTEGGYVVAEGTPESVCQNPQSVTGRYLSGRARIAVPEKRRRIARTRSLTLLGVSTNNLKDVDVRFPLRALVCVTGVSGSGKSSLVNKTLAPCLLRRLGAPAPKPGPHRGLRGINQLDKVIQIDQSPIGRTPRSNPATYMGIFDEVRKVFASTREAKQYGYGAGRFSFNNKDGRCERCQGQGVQKIEMSFLPDLFVTCDNCNGARFNRQTLRVRYRGRTISDVLEMRVDEAADFFQNFSQMDRMLTGLRQVGLGYLPLGQPSTTLSGGEAQRIKLATELSRAETGRTLYLLDEPTTGLHFDDIKHLLDVLQRLVNKGNTVIVIEHNLDVIKCADWIIDLGPEGGQLGGYILAEGSPEKVAALHDNQTGQHLRLQLDGHR